MVQRNEETCKVTEVELVYHGKTKVADRPVIFTSTDAYDLFLKTWDMNKIELQEQFRIMLLDRKNSCIGVSTVATGGITNCLADLKIVFAMALKARATNIIIAHNHPSGNIKPSQSDVNLTSRFVKAGQILELPVLDHLIVTPDGYLSLAEEGMLTP